MKLNLVFFCTTKKRFGRNDYYKHTLENLKQQTSLSYYNLIANIKTFPGEDNDLEEFTKTLSDLGFNVLINKSKINPHSKDQYFEYINGYKSDIINVFQDDVFHRCPYTFWLEDDSPPLIIDKAMFSLDSVLSRSVSILENNHKICSVYQNRGTVHPQDVEQTMPEPMDVNLDTFIHNRDFTFQPNVSRTKDLYYAANVLKTHYPQLGNIHNEQAFTLCLKSIFAQHYSIACFNPKKVCSLHCAHDNFESIDKEVERFINSAL